MSVSVMVCVNDHRNGNPHGHITALHVTAEDLELASPYLYDSDGPVFRRLSDREVRVGRRLYAISGYREWVGNWCWDAVSMCEDEAGRLVTYLLERGWVIEACAVSCVSAWLTDAIARTETEKSA